MDRYQLIAELHHHFTSLEQRLDEMKRLFSTFTLLSAKVFTLPTVEKGKEHDPISHIRVNAMAGVAARDAGLAHFQRLFIHHYTENISSKAAIRLPGVLCFQVTLEQHALAMQLIETINSHKALLEHLITRESGLAADARFEFVHTHLPGLITLSAYRSLTVLVNPATVRFGWANKHVINTLTRDTVITTLEKSLNAKRGIAASESAQWQAAVTQELIDVKRLPEDVILKIKRPVKVQPIARVWYQEEQKQVQHPCPSPLLVLCPEPEPAPVIGQLSDYDEQSLRPKYKPQAKPLRLLIPRLHLYIDESI